MNAQDFLVEDEISVVRNTQSDGRGRPNYSVMRRDVIERREAEKQEESSSESSSKEDPGSSKGKSKLHKQKSTYKEDKAAHKEKVVQKEEKVLPVKPALTNTSPKKLSTTTSKLKPPASIRVVEAASKLDRRATSRSPSPPRPPTQAVQWVIGRNKFTDEERAYMLQYLPKLFNRDPEAAYNALGVKMQQKVCYLFNSCKCQENPGLMRIPDAAAPCQLMASRSQQASGASGTGAEEGLCSVPEGIRRHCQLVCQR